VPIGQSIEIVKGWKVIRKFAHFRSLSSRAGNVIIAGASRVPEKHKTRVKSMVGIKSHRQSGPQLLSGWLDFAPSSGRGAVTIEAGSR